MSRKAWSTVGQRTRAGAWLALTVALGGCMVTSVSPVVAKGDRELDARLVGSWRNDEDQESAVITAADSEYAVVYREQNGKAGRFLGRLGRAGAYRVLDLTPDEDPGLNASDAYKALLLPLHTFLIVDSLGSELHVRALQPDSVESFLEGEPTAIAHVNLESGIVLTAPTPELKAFVERFAARPGALGRPATWRRR